MARPLRSARQAEEGGHASPAFVLPRRVIPLFLAYAFLQRLFTTYARCRSLSAEGLEKNNFREIFYSRQAAKVAKEKHGYFCSGFSRLMLAVARLAQKKLYSHAEPQRLLSRRDDTYERMSSLRGLRPFGGENRETFGLCREYVEI